MNFYIGEILLGTATATSNVATLDITLNGDTWAKGFSFGNSNTLKADFGGSSDLMVATATATLTVQKGVQAVTTVIIYGKTTFTYGDAAPSLATGAPTFNPTRTIKYTSSDVDVIFVVENTGVTAASDIKIKEIGNGTTTEDSVVQTITITQAATPTSLTTVQPSTIGGKGSIAIPKDTVLASDNFPVTLKTAVRSINLLAL